MAKKVKKEVKAKVKEEVKKVEDKVEVKVNDKKKDVKCEVNLKEIKEKRDKLIAEIQPKLLTKSQLKKGGSTIRTKYALESGYAVVLPEINALGAKLSLKPIGLGNLRRD